MKKVIYVGEEPKEEKGVEFTHYLSIIDGWCFAGGKPSDFEKIVYLGKCETDGDMFAVYSKESIFIYKGHLNNGTY